MAKHTKTNKQATDVPEKIKRKAELKNNKVKKRKWLTSRPNLFHLITIEKIKPVTIIGFPPSFFFWLNHANLSLTKRLNFVIVTSIPSHFEPINRLHTHNNNMSCCSRREREKPFFNGSNDTRSIIVVTLHGGSWPPTSTLLLYSSGQSKPVDHVKVSSYILDVNNRGRRHSEIKEASVDVIELSSHFFLLLVNKYFSYFLSSKKKTSKEEVKKVPNNQPS